MAMTGNHFNFDLGAEGQCRYADSGSCRIWGGKLLGVDWEESLSK